jgi:hypothetical protein
MRPAPTNIHSRANIRISWQEAALKLHGRKLLKSPPLDAVLGMHQATARLASVVSMLQTPVITKTNA